MGCFRRWLDDLALKEVPLVDRKFTWSNGQDNPILVKLDMVFCSVDWEDLYPNSSSKFSFTRLGSLSTGVGSL